MATTQIFFGLVKHPSLRIISSRQCDHFPTERPCRNQMLYTVRNSQSLHRWDSTKSWVRCLNKQNRPRGQRTARLYMSSRFGSICLGSLVSEIQVLYVNQHLSMGQLKPIILTLAQATRFANPQLLSSRSHISDSPRLPVLQLPVGSKSLGCSQK